MAAVYFCDPSLVATPDLRSFAGMYADATTPVDAPLERFTIEAGLCACLHYKGPYSDMKAAYDWLFGRWLPSSGREAAERPGFEIYLNSPLDTAPMDLLTDIYLPLKG
jgi:AraC family transcriptional regulator